MEKFIQAQKTFLESTNTDIARLRELRKDVENNAPRSFEELGEKVRLVNTTGTGPKQYLGSIISSVLRVRLRRLNSLSSGTLCPSYHEVECRH